jgi:hypothetical protein
MTLTRSRRKLLDAATAIRLSPDQEEAAFTVHRRQHLTPAAIRKTRNHLARHFGDMPDPLPFLKQYEARLKAGAKPTNNFNPQSWK